MAAPATHTPLIPSPLPTRRLILLGASNLTRGFAVAMQTATRLWNEPLDIMAAAGHGRSYGNMSRVLIRSLPGITACGLWPALGQRPPLPTRALVTDIGNDLFYGIGPAEIVDWVSTCFDRLEQHGAEITVTGLPICNLPRVTPRRYYLVVRTMFPGCQLPFDEAVENARELDRLVRALATERKIPIVDPVAGWYGLDPLHVRLRYAPTAWHKMLTAGLELDGPPRLATVSPRMYLQAALIQPEQRWLFSYEQRRDQPVLSLPGGTQVSMY